MRPRPAIACAILAASLAASALRTAGAGTPQTWFFTVDTTGNDVSWTSPTSVSGTAELYDGAYEITTLEVWVRYLFFNSGRST
jgi:hypothetical protein